MIRLLSHIPSTLRSVGRLVASMLVATSLVQIASAQELGNDAVDAIPVTLDIVGGDSLSVDPGSTVTVVYRIAAQSDSTIQFTPDFDIPDGWSIVFGTQDIEVVGSDPVTRFVTYKVSENALAGVYEPVFELQSEKKHSVGRITSKVNVHSLHDLSIEAGPAPSFLAAGKSFDVLLTVANDGNATVEIELSADDRRYTHIELDAERITLDPGSSRDVMARVSTDADAERSQRIVMRFDASMVEDEEVATYASVAFDIVPVFARMKPKAANTPLSLSVETVGDESGISPQATIHAAGKLFGGNVRVAATLADSPRKKLYGQEPQVTVQYARDDLSLTVGDHSTYTSPMTLTGERGVGVAAQIQKEAWSVKGSIQRSRSILPVQERAAISASWNRSETSQISANLLHRNEYYDGTLLTVRSLSRPFGPTSKLDVECGISSSQALQDPSCMIQASGSTKRISYQLRSQRASVDFPGTLAGTRMVSAFTSYRFAPSWRIEQMTSTMSRNVGSGANRDNFYAKVGFNYSARIANGNLYATAHGIRSSSRYSLLEGTTERIQNTLRLSAGYHLRRKGLTVSLEQGDASSNQQNASGALTRLRFNGRYSIAANVHLNGSFEHSQGNLSSTVADQKNRQYGLGTTVTIRPDLRATVTAFRSVIESQFRQQYVSFRGGVTKTFRSGRVLGFQAQLNHNEGRQSLRTADYRLSFTTPLDIPFSGSRRSGDILNGRVVDHITGAPIADVLLFLGNDLAITDDQGRFRFARPGQDIAFLRLDASTIGYDRTPVIPLPMEIGPDRFTEEELVIPISGTATVNGHISLYRNRETGQNLIGDENQALAKVGGLSGGVVQIENASLRRRTRTSSDGSFVFSQLPPGMYTVSVVRSNLDANQRLETDEIKVMLEVDEVSALEFRVLPARKRIRMITTSNLSLSPGSTTGTTGAASESVDEDPVLLPEGEDAASEGTHVMDNAPRASSSEETTPPSGNQGWFGSLKESARSEAETKNSAQDAGMPSVVLLRGTPRSTPPHPAYPLLFVLCLLFLLVDLDLFLRSLMERKQQQIHLLQEPRWMNTARFIVLYGFAITTITSFGGPLAGLSVSLALSGLSVAIETKATYRAILNVTLLFLVAGKRKGHWIPFRETAVLIEDVSLDEVRIRYINGLESTVPTHCIHAMSPLTRRSSSNLEAVTFDLGFSRMSNLRQIRSMLGSLLNMFQPSGVVNHVHIAFDDLDAEWTAVQVRMVAPADHQDIRVIESLAEAEFMAAGIPLMNPSDTTAGMLSRVATHSPDHSDQESKTVVGTTPVDKPHLRLVKCDNGKAA